MFSVSKATDDFAAEGGILERRKELRWLAGRVLDAQETERRRIARELHDDFKQRLGALGFELAALAERVPVEPSQNRGKSGGDPAKNALLALVDQVIELGDDIRHVSHQIHPAALERLGLAAALEAHAAEVEAREGVNICVTLRDADGPLSASVALGMYRIAQEAVENASRHAAAQQVYLSLFFDRSSSDQEGAAGTVRLRIADDGVGFDPNDGRARCGLGLTGMAERAQLLGGQLLVKSEPGAGTEIEFVLSTEHAIDDVSSQETGAIELAHCPLCHGRSVG